MPIIVSPRSRYIRSYDTSDGTVRVQLPQVNTQKLSSTTRPRRSAIRKGLSLMSQLVLVSSGAGVPPAPSAGAGRRIAAVSPATIAVPTSTDLCVVMLSTSLRVIWISRGPTWCALVREHGAAHQRNTTGRVQLVGRGRACGFRHEQLVAKAEGESERRAAGGGGGGGPARHAVRVHGVHVELIGVLLGDHEAAAVGTKRHLRRSHVRAREGPRGARDRRESTARPDREAGDGCP